MENTSMSSLVNISAMFVLAAPLALIGCMAAPDSDDGSESVWPAAEPLEAPSGEKEAKGLEAGIPAYCAPTNAAPTIPAPSYPAPTFGAPTHEAPTYKAPAYRAPTYQQPSEAPVMGAPRYAAPSYAGPTFKAPVYEAPVYEAPSFPAPNYEAPTYAQANPMQPANPKVECPIETRALPCSNL